MNKDKSIKDLKERNYKLKNQYELLQIRYYHEVYVNKKLEQELNKNNKIIEEIKILIKNYKDLCKDKGLNMHLTISMIEDILKGDK